jgi:IS30 family transposase
MPRDFPENSRMRISRQTIYVWLAHDDHRRRWRVFLRHYRRRKRTRRVELKPRRTLASRPAVINDRLRCGDWEGDLVVSAGHSRAAVATIVERQCGFAEIIPVASRRTPLVRRAILRRLSGLPQEVRLSLTFDRGSEFASFAEPGAAAGFDVYFADPHSPWQRGSNENFNGLLRQIFPKGTRFAEVTSRKVAAAQDLLNDRPRRRLNFQTPREVFRQKCCLAIQT